MAVKNDGGSAFACASDRGHQQGMSLRDYYAAHCPITLTECLRGMTEEAKLGITNEQLFAGFAQKRMEYADAMLKERG